MDEWKGVRGDEEEAMLRAGGGDGESRCRAYIKTYSSNENNIGNPPPSHFSQP